VVRMYRRELQRNYVMLLLVGVGAQSDPEQHSDALETERPGTVPPKAPAQAERSAEWLSSPLADAALQYRAAKKRPSEFRAALRDGLAHLSAKIDKALKRAKDPRTASHLRDLHAELRNAI
jgi:hypothetical protein